MPTDAHAAIPDLARRRIMMSAASAAVLAAFLPKLARAAMPSVTIENFTPAGKSLGPAQVAKVVKSEAEWRKQLAAESFEVTRHADTEQPFTGVYWNNHADGLYRCICCDTALFDSRTKFESGTGWPSFWQPISALNVAEITTPASSWIAPRSPASVATPIWATSSTTVRSRPASLLHEFGGAALRQARLTRER